MYSSIPTYQPETVCPVYPRELHLKDLLSTAHQVNDPYVFVETIRIIAVAMERNAVQNLGREIPESEIIDFSKRNIWNYQS